MKRFAILAVIVLAGCGGQAGVYNNGDGTGCTDASVFGKCKYTKQRQCCAETDPWKCNCSKTCPCQDFHTTKPQ